MADLSLRKASGQIYNVQAKRHMPVQGPRSLATCPYAGTEVGAMWGNVRGDVGECGSGSGECARAMWGNVRGVGAYPLLLSSI
eukprot:2165342-Rhodomonas_salina.1